MRVSSINIRLIALSLIVPMFGFAQDSGIDDVNKGLTKLFKGDFDGAIEAYDQAIVINPRLTTAYINRGAAKQVKGDMDAALADYNRALELDAKSSNAYQARGSLNYARRNWAEALQDLNQSCALSDKNQDYSRIHIWLIQTRQDETETANKELAGYLEKQKNAGRSTWPSKIAGYLLGNMSEADLLAAAKSTDATTEQGQLCEVWYYAGMKKLMAGSRAGAGVYFRKCLATNIKIFVEYQFAEVELKALGQ